MRRDEEMKMTHSGILVKNGKRYVSVRFERGSDVAEAMLPDCKVTKNTGFSKEEVEGLEGYLVQENEPYFLQGKRNQSNQKSVVGVL